MKNVFALFLLIVLTISSTALSIVTRKQIQVVDEDGNYRTDLTSATVYNVGTTTASTIYTTTGATVARTNPMTSSSTNTGLGTVDGTIDFCSAADTFDLQIIVGGVTIKFFTLSVDNKKLTVPHVVSTAVVVSPATATEIWISPEGSDEATGNGSFNNPYKTITKAFTEVTATRKTVLAMPGEYAEEHAVIWPNVSGVRVKGVCGGVTFVGKAGEDSVFIINPTYTASTFEAYLEAVECEVAAGAYGVNVNNANMTKKLNVYLKGVTFSGEAADNSLREAHSSADNAVRVYVDGDGAVWEGIVTFVCANTGDRLRIKNQILLGGITTTGDVAGEIFLENTGILASGNNNR